MLLWKTCRSPQYRATIHDSARALARERTRRMVDPGERRRRDGEGMSRYGGVWPFCRNLVIFCGAVWARRSHAQVNGTRVGSLVVGWRPDHFRIFVFISNCERSGHVRRGLAARRTSTIFQLEICYHISALGSSDFIVRGVVDCY